MKKVHNTCNSNREMVMRSKIGNPSGIEKPNELPTNIRMKGKLITEPPDGHFNCNQAGK